MKGKGALVDDNVDTLNMTAPGGVRIDGHELAERGVLADDGVRLRGGNVHDVRQGMEPGLQRPRAQPVPRQRLLHALAVLAAAPKLVQVGVLQGPHRF